MADHIFVGFGFGPIQAGLFVKEAFQCSNFSRIVVAEIDTELVKAIRANKGEYSINVAGSEGLDSIKISGIEIYNPRDKYDRELLLKTLGSATDVVTALPSVSFYDSDKNSIAALIAEAFVNSLAKAAMIYAAENHNHAAEILQEKVNARAENKIIHPVQYLNTVIGKMSKVVNDPEEIRKNNLTSIVPDLKRAFLVEEFNKILVDKCRLENFKPGIEVFNEKENLLPFEEAKLFGHNAVHALLAYLGAYRGYETIKQLKNDTRIMQIAHNAFVNECGAALIRKHSSLNDVLFTEDGFKEYAEDLLRRMTNPYLEDTIERTGRDLVRKLGYNDRIFGTMRLALSCGIEPVNMAMAGAAGLIALLKKTDTDLPEHLHFDPASAISRQNIESLLNWLWPQEQIECRDVIVDLLEKAFINLKSLT